MKIKAPASHDLPQLLDELLAAKDAEGKSALLEEGRTLTYDRDDPTMLIVPAKEGVTASQVQPIFTAHTPVPRPPPPNLKVLADNVRTALSAATTLNQVKAVIGGPLMKLLREIAQGHRGETNGS